MVVFICNGCGAAFSVENAEAAVCPTCGVRQNVPADNADEVCVRFDATQQISESEQASLNEFAAVLSGGAQAREFSVSKMRGNISAAYANETMSEALPVPDVPAAKPSETAFRRREVEADPPPTKKQLKNAQKQQKKDEKERKRNEKLDRQYRRNSNKALAVVAVFLLFLAGGLMLMQYYDLSFLDLPAVFSGERPLREAPTPTAPSLQEPKPAGPVMPPIGEYIVSNYDGVLLRKSASVASERLAAIRYGYVLEITSVKPDAEDETVFWGRTSYGGAQGWVNLDYMKYVEPAPTMEVVG